MIRVRIAAEVVLGGLLMYLGVELFRRSWRRQRSAMREGLLGSAFIGWPQVTLLALLIIAAGAAAVIAAVR